MTTSTEHYAYHLAPIYLWMAGGADTALEAGSSEVEALQLPLHQGDLILDLGAGFGMHAIPLARRGARVLAIDTSATLLRTLTEISAGVAIQTLQDELLNFQSHISEAPAAILCMGDTLTHLPSLEAVNDLIASVAEVLQTGGTFVLTFRDYTVPLVGDQRFIPVRSDDSRILMCFLEYEPESVIVHDILYQRAAGVWQTELSHYRKIRLSPEYLLTKLQSSGFKARREDGMRGMVRIIAQKTK